MSTNLNSTPPSPSEIANRQQADYSKTRSVVRTDLTIKAITAIAVASIGFASFRLQRDSTAARDETAKREAQEQQYLPFFRSVSEVDIALAEISAQFGWQTNSEEEAKRESVLGTRLAYLADSLYFPLQDFQANEPRVFILTAEDKATGKKDAQAIELSGENTVRLLSEVMRITPMLRSMTEKGNVMVQVKDGALVFENNEGKSIGSVPLDARSVSSFMQWLPKRTKVDYLYDEFDLSTMADDIAGQLITVTKKILAQHPELADKYVVIRDNVIRGREEIVPTVKQ